MITVNTREEFLFEVDKLLPENCVAVEIGVLYGDFSKLILDIINPNHLILIDPYEKGGELYSSGLSSAYSTQTDYDNITERFKEEIAIGQVMLRRKYSHEIVSRYPDNSIDFCYHDASHLYHDLKRDLNDWLPKLKNNSVMAGHDCISDPNFGVIDAVNEFMQEQNYGMIIFNINGGDWALQKKLINE